MRRAIAGIALVLVACAGPRMRADPGTGRVSFSWATIETPPDAAGRTYELRVWAAEQGLPRGAVLRAEGLTDTQWRAPRTLRPGDYVWSVRARYLRGGLPCASPWNGAGRSALTPPRRLPAFTVPPDDPRSLREAVPDLLDGLQD